jgi:carbohydrate-selective porin OprB
MRFVNTVGLLLAPLVGFALLATDACAETLYKLIDRNGKVTYVQDPPKNFDGKVIRLDIDTSANTATGRRPASPQTSNEAIIHRQEPDAARLQGLKAAQEKLEAARKAYADARDNPREGDVQRMGNVRGGARPVFSEEYQKRLDQLEAQVREAEQEVDKLERGR